MRRGFIFTLDAMLMLIPIFIITITVYNAISEAKYLEEEQFATLAREKLCEQTMSVLEKSGVLESIAQAYALNDTERLRNIIENELKPLIPAHLNFSIKIENDTYSSGTSQEFLCSASRVITGYAKGKPALGYMARAYLTKIRSKTEKEVIGWQRVLTSSCAGESQVEYVCICEPRFWCFLLPKCWERILTCNGEENNLIINHTFFLPDDFDRTTATNSWLRILPRIPKYGNAKCEQVCINVNGNNRGCASPGEVNNIEDYLVSGKNYITTTINTTGYCNNLAVELGTGSGSILYLEYQTSQMFTGYSTRTYLYNVQSQCVIKYQNSLFVPGNITRIHIRVKTKNIDKVYLAYTWGANVYPLLNKTPIGGIVEFNDTEIRTALESYGFSYENISGKVFNLNLYFDVDPNTYENESKNLSLYVSCHGTKNRYIYGYPESFIEILYDPSIITTSLYMIDIPVTLDDYEAWGASERVYFYDYYENVKWYYTFPNNSIPWYLDIWLASLWSGNVNKQNFYDNDYLIYGTNKGDPVDIYLIRFAYTKFNESMMIPGKTNYFYAQGQGNWQGFHGFAPVDNQGNPFSYGIFKYLISAYVPYGQVFSEEGGGYNLKVYYDMNGDNVPEGSINIPVKGGGSVIDVEDLDPENRAVDDAVLRLLDVMNYKNDENGENILNNKYQDASPRDGSRDNPVDIELTEEIRIESVSMGGIPELYTPITVTLRIAK